MSIYLKADNIKGNVTEPKYLNQVELESVEFQSSIPAKILVGKGHDRQQG